MFRQSDDDDIPPDDSIVRSALKAAIVAGCTAAATGLVGWAVDELRSRFGRAPASKGSGKAP